MNFEANRRKILADLARKKSMKRAEQKAHSRLSSPGVSEESGSFERISKLPIAVFGEKSLFLNNCISSLSGRCAASHFTDVDMAVEYMMDNNVNHLFIDIDPPSDYHLGVNLFTVARSVSTEVKVFVCTKDKESAQARSLNDHGCIILQKPISLIEVTKYLT